MSEELDLSECEREPIHIPGSIQPHGALLGIAEPDLDIVLASANASALLGDHGELRGRRLDELFDKGTVKLLRVALRDDPRDANPLEVRFLDGRNAHGLAHRSDGLLILEIEPASEDKIRFKSAYRRLVRRFERLRRASTLSEVCDISAHEVRALTGFDRVMVYRFDRHANGQVIAEERADESLEPFLGLHYPASDIPAQARRMYVQNPIRIIVDAGYEPVPLVPDINPLTGKPIDLSFASLRSVSPIHCAYLQNMGVASSMSISLLSGDELWGLIACHHRTPFHVPYGTRLIAEFLAHVLSARVSEIERTEALTRKNSAYAIQSRLIDQMVSAPRFQEGLTGDEQSLTDLLDCDSAAILFRGEVTRIGAAPAESEIRGLGAAMSAHARGHVTATDCLAEIVDDDDWPVDRAAGGIAVPISADGLDFIFWFRGERIRSTTWAGDPRMAALRPSDGGRLCPRGSFEAWTEEVRGRSVPWSEWEVEVASDFRTALVASIIHQAAELERLNTRLVQASEQKDRFLATVSHELRNPLNAIMGWVRIARMGPSAEDLEHALETIERNAVAQTELINDLLDVGRIEGGRFHLETEPLNLARVTRDALDTVLPNARSKSIRIETALDEDQSDIIGDPRRLQQVIWNLLSNAIKFSEPDSRIQVTLGRASSAVELTVEDEGIGIPADLIDRIFDPFKQGDTENRRSGLGLGLSIVKSIVELHGGDIAVASDGEGHGTTFRVSLPVAAVRPTFATSSTTERSRANLEGKRILVVDDHPDAAKMVATVLETRGAEATVAHNGVEALEKVRDAAPFDLIVSDLEMPEMDGFDLVAAIHDDPARPAPPAIALTAFTRGGDRAKAITCGFRHHVSKPVDADELIAVVASVLGCLT